MAEAHTTVEAQLAYPIWLHRDNPGSFYHRCGNYEFFFSPQGYDYTEIKRIIPDSLWKQETFAPHEVYKMLERYFNWPENRWNSSQGYPTFIHSFAWPDELFIGLDTHWSKAAHSKTAISAYDVFRLLYRLRFGTWLKEQEPKPEPAITLNDIVFCIKDDDFGNPHPRIGEACRVTGVGFDTCYGVPAITLANYVGTWDATCFSKNIPLATQPTQPADAPAPTAQFTAAQVTAQAAEHEKQTARASQLSSAISNLSRWRSDGRPHEYSGDFAIRSSRNRD